MIKYLVLIHSIVELLGGIVLLFRPDLLMLTDALTAPTAAVIKLFGALIFVFGLVSVLIYRRFEYDSWHKLVVLAFMGYHFIQALQCYSMYNTAVMSNIGAFTLHMTLALFFLIGFMNEREKFPT